jgi:ABC-2 type transport system ATP-binding protein
MQIELAQTDDGLAEALRGVPGVAQVVAQPAAADGSLALALHTTDSRNLMPLVIDLVGARGGRLRHLNIAQPTLEDVFIALTGKQLRD